MHPMHCTTAQNANLFFVIVATNDLFLFYFVYAARFVPQSLHNVKCNFYVINHNQFVCWKWIFHFLRRQRIFICRLCFLCSFSFEVSIKRTKLALRFSTQPFDSMQTETSNCINAAILDLLRNIQLKLNGINTEYQNRFCLQ